MSSPTRRLNGTAASTRSSAVRFSSNLPNGYTYPPSRTTQKSDGIGLRCSVGLLRFARCYEGKKVRGAILVGRGRLAGSYRLAATGKRATKGTAVVKAVAGGRAVARAYA